MARTETPAPTRPDDPLEVLLTMTPAQRRELVENVSVLRRTFKTSNVTQTVLEALRREAEAAGRG